MSAMKMADDNHLAEKVFLAFSNFVVGGACVALALISLSIVPDCAGSISGQVLLYFVIQCVVELAALLMTTFSVSYMLAVNEPNFINESFSDVPGYTIPICLTIAACLQLFSTIYKFLEILCPTLCNKIFNKIMTFLTIIGAFIIGSNRFVDDIFAKKVLKFNLDKLRWVYNSQTNNFWFNSFLGIACVVLGVLCFIAIIRIFVDNFILIEDRRYLDKFEVFKNILSALLLLLTDLIYAALLFYVNLRANSYAGRRKTMDKNPFGIEITKFLENNNFDGYIQGYIVFIWPIIGMIMNYKRVRTVIKIRSDLMMSRSQMPRAPAPRKSITKKISTVENIDMSSNNLLDSSQNSLANIENCPRKKISTISQHSSQDTPTRKNSPYLTPISEFLDQSKRESLVLMNQWTSQEWVYPPKHKISIVSQYSMQEGPKMGMSSKRSSMYSMPDTPTKKTSIILTPTSFSPAQSRQNSQEWMMDI